MTTENSPEAVLTHASIHGVEGYFEILRDGIRDVRSLVRLNHTEWLRCSRQQTTQTEMREAWEVVTGMLNQAAVKLDLLTNQFRECLQTPTSAQDERGAGQP